MDEFLILLQAKLDEAKSKGNVNSDIEKLQGQLDKLKIQAEIDPKTITNLVKQLETVLNQKIVISDIGINSNTAVKAAQQTGQQIGNAINQGVSSAVSKANKTLKSFAELKIGTGNIDAILDKDELLDAEKSLNKIKAIYSEFGQVKITNKIFDPEGNLQQFRVDIQQVNGELKESRNFMMALSSDGKSFSFPQDVIKGSESFVHHLNEAKNISNATGEELNAQKEKLAEQEKYYAKLEQASKEQLAIEKQRITAGEKQLEVLDAQSKRRDSRISYNEGQINKKGLTNTSKQREINDLAYSGKEKVDTSFAKEIDKSLSSLPKLKQKWQEQGIYVDEFRMKVETLEKSLDEISIGDVKGLNNLKQQLNSLSTEAESLNRLNEIQLSIGDKGNTTAQIKVLRDNFTKLGLSANEVSSKMNGVDKEITELKSLMNSGANGSAITAQFDKLQVALKETQNDLKTTRSEYSLLVSAQQRLNKANAIEEWKQKNSAATKQAQADTQAYIDSLRNLNVQMTKMEFDQISRGFKETENSMRGLGKLGASLKDQISQAAQSFTQWLSVSSAVMALVYQLQKVPKEVIAVNSAMIELNKVSDASTSDIKKYFDEAAESAKKYGSSVSDMINATADWSRLGYSLPDAKKLAEVATLYTNVGDGIDMSTANESLISTLQGFQLEAEDALDIINKFNEVANNFPIDTAGIGEALQRSAASFYAANTDLSKSIALITGTNSVVQDASRVGNMWKTVSMRIRGASQELEEAGLETEGMVESTAELRDLIKGLTGFDIMADEAGTQFKDIYDIVVGIGHEWQNLTDIEQAGLLEKLAGKMQGNALSAALNNVSMIEEAYKTAEDSAGSALKEQEAYEQGIEYSLKRLEASFQAFANHIVDSDFVKGIVDFGNSTINVLDAITSKLGSLGTIGLGAGIFAGTKNTGKCRMSVRISKTVFCFGYALHA